VVVGDGVAGVGGGVGVGVGVRLDNADEEADTIYVGNKKHNVGEGLGGE